MSDLMKELSSHESDIKSFDNFMFSYLELESFFQEIDEHSSLYSEICLELEKLNVSIIKQKMKYMFTNEHDKNDCFLEIQAGTGGIDSNNWAFIMLRMYTRWAKIFHDFNVTILSEQYVSDSCLKSATLKISGIYAYGWAKWECGVHRLVRISPYNANSKRQTSFANVKVVPVMDDAIDIVINDSDLRIDTFRASGAGGQHVNCTDSAIRIVHIPTGIIAQCQNERSQHQNKVEAMRILKSRLYEIELNKLKRDNDKIYDRTSEISWGNQIRSYVMNPYQMIKDTRSGVEIGNINRVLDGDLDEFIIAMQMMK